MATIGEQGPVSTHTLEKVTRAKVTLENYYTNLINQNGERESRLVSNIVALVGVCTLVCVCESERKRPSHMLSGSSDKEGGNTMEKNNSSAAT